MAEHDALRGRLVELRQSFDRAFAEPVLEEPEQATLELLAIRVGRDPYALRQAQIAAIEVDRRVTRVPSDHPELLGIAGLRGAVVAVFDLAGLLGAPRPELLRWLVLAKSAPVAFAFSAFDGQLEVRRDALAAAEPSHAGRVREVASSGGLSLPIVDIPGLIAALAGGQRARQAPFEQRGV